MIVNIILFVVFWLLGIFFYSIGMLQIILTLFFSIPITREYVSKCTHMVDSSSLYKRFAATILIWLVISFLVIGSIVIFGDSYTIAGFFVGVVIAFFLSIGKLGKNKSNVTDYFSTYGKYYAISDLEIFVADL